MSHLRIRLARLASYLPDAVALVPYHVLKGLITWLLGLRHARVWFRNSLALNYGQAGLSDIDLSVLVPTVSEAIRVTRRLREIRALSLGGETQVYVEENLRSLLPVANPFELRRDPTLCERFGLPGAGSSVEKSLFLFKCLLADGFLRVHPGLRAKRWRAMFNLVGGQLDPEVSRESIARQVLLNSPAGRLVTAKDLLGILDGNEGEARDAYPLLFPNKIAWCSEEYASLKRSLTEQSQELHDWLHAAIRWEVWGLYPMTPLFTDQPVARIFAHIENQRELLRFLRVPEAQKHATENALAELSRHYRLICDELGTEDAGFGGANRT